MIGEIILGVGLFLVIGSAIIKAVIEHSEEDADRRRRGKKW